MTNSRSADNIPTGDKPIGFGKNRVENLTDAIFAIALTLLVLGVEVPQETENTLSAAGLLFQLVPDFFHYILAFIVLAILWVFHHQQFHHIQHIDRRMVWLNIATLMFITMVPFSSSYADTFYDQQIASIFFSTNLLVIGVLIWLQWQHASVNHHLISIHVSDDEILFEKRKNMLIPILGIIAIGLSLIGVIWAAGIFYTLPVILFFLDRWHYGYRRQGPQAGG